MAANCTRLLDAFDAGLGEGAPHRARAILHEFAPHLDDRKLDAMTLGERDRELLAIRRRLFGDRLASNVPCTRCHERFEITASVDDLLDDEPRAHSGSITVRAAGDLTIVARPPTVADLEQAARARDARSAQHIILSRCVESARRAGHDVAIEDLPVTALSELGVRLEEADPSANIEFDAQCPSCGAAARYPLDVAAFLWAEIEVEALRLLHDVHRLARAYGWGEADILSLSPVRRRAYLELLPV